MFEHILKRRVQPETMDKIEPFAGTIIHPTFIIYKDNLIRLFMPITLRPIPIRNLPIKSNKIITFVFKIIKPLT